ncbi:unnamed protein product [[Candida] boidinii]|uniref:Unnamed protein product n=1 Tax=Candida boidinii TaxID=5477 RepID=A0ACB5TWX6_CANBO|nr:unnamed protein product [[Candida] boidinii]
MLESMSKVSKSSSSQSTRLNIPAPRSVNTSTPSSSSSATGSESAASGDTEKSAGGKLFTFVTRSGKKTTSTVINLPEDNKFASKFIKEEERQRKEKQLLKNLVLQSVDRNSD